MFCKTITSKAQFDNAYTYPENLFGFLYEWCDKLLGIKDIKPLLVLYEGIDLNSRKENMYLHFGTQIKYYRLKHLNWQITNSSTITSTAFGSVWNDLHICCKLIPYEITFEITAYHPDIIKKMESI